MSSGTARRACLAAMLVLFAPGCDRAAPSPAVNVTILPASAHAALARLSLDSVAPVCGSREDLCLTSGGEVAAVGMDGSVAFLGPGGREAHIVLVDPATRIPRVIGRPGSGPGEYRVVMSLGFGPAGDVRVYDGAQRRLLHFASDGAAQRTATVPWPPAPFSGGFVKGEHRFLGTEPAATPGDSTPVHLYAADPDAAEARSVRRYAVKHPSFGVADFRQLPPPFLPNAQFALDGDGGLLHTSGGAFIVDQYDTTGVHVTRFGFELDPRPVTEEDRAAEEARLLRRLPPAMRAAVVENMRKAGTHHPAITGMRAFGDGSVWVRESPHAAGDSVAWVVYQQPPAPLGRLVLDVEDRILGAHAGRILVARGGGTGAELLWMRIVGGAVAGVSTGR